MTKNSHNNVISYLTCKMDDKLYAAQVSKVMEFHPDNSLVYAGALADEVNAVIVIPDLLKVFLSEDVGELKAANGLSWINGYETVTLLNASIH